MTSEHMVAADTRLTRSTSSNEAGETSVTFPSPCPGELATALLTKTVTLPQRLAASVTSDWHCSSLVRSAGTKAAWPPADWMASTVARPRSAWRPVTVTTHPPDAHRRGTL